MATQAQFKAFLKDVEPSATAKANASAAHTAARDYLKKHERFAEYHVETFLSGSHKRNTAIRRRGEDGVELRPDVDIIVVTNHTIHDDPRVVIDALYGALAEGYEEIRKQNRSVRVVTDQAKMDVVPIVAPYGMNWTLYIPDRELDGWRETNPPRHTAWAAEVNEATDGRFKPLAKLTKWWRRENPTIAKRPKGFVVERMVADCMNRWETQHDELFVGTLEGIVTRYAPSVWRGEVPWIADPGVSGKSVTDGMTFDAFLGFYNKAKAHAELGRRAMDEEDPEKELRLWRQIFGPRFPAPAVAAKSASLLDEAAVPTGLSFPDRAISPRKPGGFA